MQAIFSRRRIYTLMKSRWWNAVWLPLVLGLFSLAVPAQQTTTGGSFTGVVVSGDGLPVAHAQVQAAETSQAAVTGSDGRFSFPKLRLPATLTVTAPGFSAARRMVSSLPVRVVLQPAPLAEQVTVTATARNQQVTSVPIKTLIVGQQRVRTDPATNFDSVLEEVTDVGTFRRSTSLVANPTTQGVSMLGIGSSGASRALVLLDGLPLNDAFGGWVDWLRVPNEAISEVSVVSGGASSLYGNDALSGVIGITTETATRPMLSLRTGGGNLGTGVLDSVADLGGDHLSGALRLRSIHTDGYVPVATPGAVDNNAGVTANDIAPVLRWTPNARAMFSLEGEYYGENRTNGTVLTVNSTALRQLAARGVVNDAGVWSGSLFTQSEAFASSYSSVASDRSSEKLVLEQRVPSLASGAALDWSTGLRHVRVVAGGSWMHISAVDSEIAPLNHASPNKSENGRQRLLGAFTEVEWLPLPSLSFMGTVRADQWRNYSAFEQTNSGATLYPNRSSSAWSPSLGMVWKPRGPVSFRASAYQSFRAPTLNELYRPFRVGNVVTNANPLLAAERYRGMQVGADVALPIHGLLRATWFDGEVSNVITNVTVSTTPSLITRQRQNIGRIKPRGESLDAQFQPLPFLTLWGDWTHLHSVVTSAADASLIGLQVAHVPANNFTLRALSTWRGWEVSGVERFGGAQFDDDLNLYPLPSYWTTDLFVSHRITTGPAWMRGIAPYFAVENVWNRRYAVEVTPTDYLNSPRSVTAGLRIQLGTGR